MRRLPLMVLSSLLAAPLTAQGSITVAPGQAVLLGVRYPESVGTFAASRITRYPDPALGMSVSYVSQGLGTEASVYVYPIQAGAPDDHLRQQFDADWAGVKLYAERAREMEVSVEGETEVEIVAPDGRQHRGWKGEIVMRRQGKASASFLYLFEKDGSYLKYRVTYDRSTRLATEPEVQAFIAETLAEVLP